MTADGPVDRTGVLDGGDPDDLERGDAEPGDVEPGDVDADDVEVDDVDAEDLEPDEAGEVRRRRRWRPAAIHRIGDLPLAHRRGVQAGLIGLALLPVLSAVIVLVQGWRPAGDNALIGLRVHDVLTGHFPLIGQPTTGENFGSGIATSHPGPIEFYLVAPFVAVLGPTIGLAIGAAVINGAGFVTVGWLGFRRGGTGLMVLASLSSVAMARALGGNILHDPVSSNVGSVVSLALLYAAWSVIAGDLRTLPVFIAAGTFALQDHLSYLGTGSPVVLVALLIGLWWLGRMHARSPGLGWLRRTVIVSTALGLVLWLPVLIDEFWGDHNLNAIFKTFTGKRTPGEGLTFAYQRVAEALSPVPLFVRRVGPLGYLSTPTDAEMVRGFLVLAAVIVLGVVFVRRRDTALAALALVVVVATVAGGYTAMKLPVGAGIQASNLRWMWTVSAFAWVALLWMGWQVLPAFWREVLRTPVEVVGAVALIAAVAGTVATVDLSTDRDGNTAEDTSTLIANVKENLPEGTYRVEYAGGSVVVSVGPALVHDLDHRGDRLLMDIGPFTRAYADHRAYGGEPVDGTILVTAEADGFYPEGTKLLARQEFEVNRKDGALNTIRVYLVSGDQ